jgi:hypothetical protein
MLKRQEVEILLKAGQGTVENLVSLVESSFFKGAAVSRHGRSTPATTGLAWGGEPGASLPRDRRESSGALGRKKNLASVL